MMKLIWLVIVAGLVCENIQKIRADDTDADEKDEDEEEGFIQKEDDEKRDEPDTVIVGPPVRPSPPRFCNYPKNLKCWTEWFDGDDPCEKGDFELLKDLLKKYPGKICLDPVDIEVKTLDGKTFVEAGDKITTPITKYGFVCKNEDQKDKKCSDYRVRFSCYSPFCAKKVCWTPFYDRDNPSGTGDWETLTALRKKHPGEICKKPMFIKALTTDGLTPASLTGDKFLVFSPTKGLACVNKAQKDKRCRDYKVSFGCPCKHEWSSGIHRW